jgi:hypothetical protein
MDSRDHRARINRVGRAAFSVSRMHDWGHIFGDYLRKLRKEGTARRTRFLYRGCTTRGSN